MPFSRGSSQPRDWNWVSCTAGRFFTIWTTREALRMHVRACLVTCLTLCNPMDYSLPGLCPWDFPGKNTGVGGHALPQGIFPTQGLYPCLLWLLHCRWILYHWATGGAQVCIWECKIKLKSDAERCVYNCQGHTKQCTKQRAYRAYHISILPLSLLGCSVMSDCFRPHGLQPSIKTVNIWASFYLL